MKVKIIYIICIGFTIVLFLVTLFFYFKKVNEYWGNQVQIKRDVCIDTTVDKVLFDHGSYSFDDQYYLTSGSLLASSINLYDLIFLENPFELKKKCDNDTIRVIKGDTTLFFILK